MENKLNIKAINRLIYIGLITLIISLIFVVSKYIGIWNLFIKILKALIPVAFALFVSFILEPLIGIFIKRKIRRRYSVLIVYGLLILIVGLLLYFIVPALKEQVVVFVENIPSLINTVEVFLNNVGINISNESINNFVNSILVNTSNSLIRYLSSSISVIFDLLLGISGALFLSFDFPKCREKVKNVIPKSIKQPVIYYFQNYLPFIHKYFLGMLIDSILTFIISMIGFSIIGIEYPLIISLIIAITNLIPIIGPYIGGIPAAIVGFTVSKSLGISAIIVVVIVQIIESNFMQPLILKNVISLHPIEGILGISLFGSLFGILGMILSPILIVGIKLLFLPYNEKIEKEIVKEINDG